MLKEVPGPFYMEIQSSEIPEVLLIKPTVIEDERGYFVETFNKRLLADAIGSVDFVQSNQSLSRRPFTVRGLHFQIPPFAQAKLVRVLSGAILDVAVDLRRASPYFGRHVRKVLTAVGFEQLWVPAGFAHGFCSLEADSVVSYKVNNFFDPASERGIRWDDPELGIEWGVDASEVTLSARDRRHPNFRELTERF
jgi:dTDP-4-dehydrorhamnose 3,5-epimerase